MAVNPETVAELNELACDFYQARLADAPETAKYARSRGLSEATIEHWKLGYAPKGPNALLTHLTDMGWPVGAVVESGLAYASERGAIDAFRNRLVFPIIDRDGKRILAFSTRQLSDDGSPKYLNTSTTPIFAKRETFYGWPNAEEVSKRGEAYVVEGNVDMLALWNAGVRNVFAVCGTALTEEHLALLAELCNRVTLVLDADASGVKATQHSLLMAEASRLDIGVISVTGGKDPADLLEAEGIEGWQLLVAERVDRWEWLWRALRAPHAAALERDISEDDGAAVARVEAAIAFKDAWCSLVAEHGGEDAQALLDRMALELDLSAAMLAQEFLHEETETASEDDAAAADDEMLLLSLVAEWDHLAPLATCIPLASGLGRRTRDAWLAAGSPKLNARQRHLAHERADEIAALRTSLASNYRFSKALANRRRELLGDGQFDQAKQLQRAYGMLMEQEEAVEPVDRPVDRLAGRLADRPADKSVDDRIATV